MSYHIWQTEESSEDVDSRGLTDNSALFGDQGTRMDPRVGVNASDDQRTPAPTNRDANYFGGCEATLSHNYYGSRQTDATPHGLEALSAPCYTANVAPWIGHHPDAPVDASSPGRSRQAPSANSTGNYLETVDPRHIHSFPPGAEPFVADLDSQLASDGREPTQQFDPWYQGYLTPFVTAGLPASIRRVNTTLRGTDKTVAAQSELERCQANQQNLVRNIALGEATTDLPAIAHHPQVPQVLSSLRLPNLAAPSRKKGKELSASTSATTSHRCICSKCKKSLKDEAGLRKHSKTHDPTTCTFECTVAECKRRFRYPKDLRRHGLTHSKPDTPEFMCTKVGCDKGFDRHDFLLRHRREAHISTVVPGPLSPEAPARPVDAESFLIPENFPGQEMSPFQSQMYSEYPGSAPIAAPNDSALDDMGTMLSSD